MQNAVDQIERMKKVFGVKTDTALAQKLGKDKNTVSVWKRRNAIPTDVIKKVSLDESVSMDWLVSGSGRMEMIDPSEAFDQMGVIGGLLSDERSVRIVQLLPYAPKEFIDQVITRLEEFKRLSHL